MDIGICIHNTKYAFENNDYLILVANNAGGKDQIRYDDNRRLWNVVAGGNYKTIINCCIGISSVVAPHTDHPLIKDGFATDAILWHLMHIYFS